jgi:hypothetical protein
MILIESRIIAPRVLKGYKYAKFVLKEKKKLRPLIDNHWKKKP